MGTPSPGVLLGLLLCLSAPVANGQTVTVHFDLQEIALSLDEVVVTPGRFSMQRAVSGSVQSISADDLNRMPGLGDDVYRAVRRIPGLSGSDFSARFTVRGGEHDEVLVTLDGMELQDPFHMKDIGGGAMSIVDVEAIGGVDLMTGAFTAEYGNRLSGVFALTSAQPHAGEAETTLGLSLMNARLRSQGTFLNPRRLWRGAQRLQPEKHPALQLPPRQSGRRHGPAHPGTPDLAARHAGVRAGVEAEALMR